MKTVKLSEIADSIDYGVTASASEEPIGPKFLRITDIQNGGVDWSSVPFCKADERKLTSSRLIPGDIVFARTGATTGKSFLIRDCPVHAVFASYLIRVRPSPQVDPIFLSHFFDHPSYWRQISLKSAGAAQPGVNSSKLKDLEVPLPPLEEQKRIAAMLDQADELRRLRQRAFDRLQELSQAIFHEMFGDWRFSSPKWPLVLLGPKLDFLTSGSRGWAEFYRDRGGKFLRIQNVKRDDLDLSDIAFVEAPATAEARRTRVQSGDVLLSITADLGRTAVVPADIGEAYINQHLAIIRSAALGPRFLSAALASPAGQADILKKNREGVKAGLNFDDVRSIQIPDAPLREQRTLAERLAEVDKLKFSYSTDLSKLHALFASLQHRAFTGELTSKDAERELAVAG